jgi:acetyl esterase/lipase
MSRNVRPVARDSAHETAILRLWVAVVLFLASLLAIMPAQTYYLWKASIAGAELGHIVAIAALFTLLIPGWWRTIIGQLAGGITVVALALAISPLARAWSATRDLDARLTSAFGAVPVDSVSSPLALRPLFEKADTSGVTVATAIYARRGDTPLELDLYRARADSTSVQPLVVTIHGGSWSSGEKTALPELNYHLAREGYTVAALGYRFAPDNPFPAATEDVNTAIDYLKAHARQFRIDPSHVVLIGRSAGGQLALQSAYTKPDSSIRGVVALYAPTDQQWGWDHPANLRVYDSYAVLRRFLNGEPSQVPEAYKRASPINYIGSHTIPTLLIHGRMDPLVSVQQSARLDSALAAARRPHFFLELPWATHGCDYFFNGPCGQVSRFAIDRFLKAVLH